MTTLTIAAIINLVFSLVLVGIEVWAFINAARFRADAYSAAFKRTKGFWLAMTGGAVAVGLLTAFTSTLGAFSLMLGIAAFVVAGVFLADVLPALRSVMSRAQGRYGWR